MVATVALLVAAIQAGDVSTFPALVQRFEPQMRAASVRYESDTATPSDIYAETLGRLLHAAQVMPADVEDPAAYLSTAVHMAALQHVRSAGRHADRYAPTPHEGLDDLQEAHQPSPEDLLLASEERALLADAVAGLPADQRDVIRRLFWEGETPAQVAAALGCCERSIYRLKHRALEALRSTLTA